MWVVVTRYAVKELDLALANFLSIPTYCPAMKSEKEFHVCHFEALAKLLKSQ